ncbi:unnamed protein product [Adineta steineri]|uniref:Metallo-beta-lactamase domain-containing protein n=1 Tax=Adineta steineri TaxID=433720 RepID=A0A813UEQ0_9BILA|nr:unnamed protein product [Adineta steineri]CAF0828156.1 unnamed protein product [Adineta steineri]
MSAKGSDPAHIEKDELFEVATNFWNIRVSFKMLAGLVDLGSHMSLIRLNNGNFLVIDTVILTDHTRAEINRLTDNGAKIEAVIGVHPFHTLAFPAFYEAYPNAKYYGTPRHIRRLTTIPWAGSLDDCNIRKKWEPEIEMRIPAGAEFVNPLPESSNHFVSVFVFHRPSRTLHVDDTIIYGDHPGFLLKLTGFKHGTMAFQPSIKGAGLYPTAEAPFEFRDWMKTLLNDWPFDNICCAHSGIKIGGAHEQVIELVNTADALFNKLSEKNRKKNPNSEIPAGNHPNMNVSGDECG